MLLTKSTTFIIGPVAQVEGYIMDAIFRVCDSLFSIQNIGLCIILFTVAIYLLMTPLTIKQQKFSKLSAKMNPELQAIQKKYKNKKDQDSMLKMNEETKAVYARYGVSPMGSCLQLIIQMPILFALWRVINNIPAYVTSVKEVFQPLAENLLNLAGSQEALAEVAQANQINFESLGYTTNTIIDTLYKFSPDNWKMLAEKFPDIASQITATQGSVDHMNNFLSLNISNSPFAMLQNGMATGSVLLIIAALMIPVLAGLTQWLNTKLMPQAASTGNNDNGTMSQSLKTMNTVMPLMSVVFCFTLPAGMGIYWIAGAVIRSIQQIVINKHIDSIDLDELLKKNLEKENKKRAKMGLPPQKITNQAKTNVKKIDTPAKKEVSEEERKKKIQQSTEYYKTHADAKPGSIASKARMVQQFNEKNKK